MQIYAALFPNNVVGRGFQKSLKHTADDESHRTNITLHKMTRCDASLTRRVVCIGYTIARQWLRKLQIPQLPYSCPCGLETLSQLTHSRKSEQKTPFPKFYCCVFIRCLATACLFSDVGTCLLCLC